ncbi:MAG: DNA double-strand break repair nuclease NurA [Thermoproteota archaeon]|nr:DNA double-strand break repair nuclease NurA [Thermoproteota archaeon]
MAVEVVRELIEKLDENIKEGDLGKPFFSDPRYRAFSFLKENFKPIEHVDSDRMFVFVDGGNQEVLGAPNFSVQINRVYFNAFQGQKRVLDNSLPDRIEFFSATHSRFRNGEIFYDTHVVPLTAEFKDLLPDESDLSFNSFDRTVMVGRQRADISRVASIARKFAEWEYAFHLIQKEMGKGDVLVIDGTLQTTFKNESKYAKKVYDAAKLKNVIVTGLSKTSRLFTTTGLSLLGAVSKFAADTKILYDSWCLPVAEAITTDHNAFIFAVKLAGMADHIFRYEIYREQYKSMDQETVNEILSQLAENACDVSFPGYPYGLVDADRFARVTGGDVESYQVLLLSEISKRGGWQKFARHIHAADAHSILNMLMG